MLQNLQNLQAAAAAGTGPVHTFLFIRFISLYLESTDTVYVTTLTALVEKSLYVEYEENLKYWKQTLNLTKIYTFILYFL